MTEVLITIPLADDLLRQLNGVSPQLHMNFHPARKADEIPLDIWGRTEILLTEKILPSTEKAPNLKWIQFVSSGIDSWVGNPIFNKPGLLITTLSGAAVSQMAEHVVMMMLALGHKLPALSTSQRKKEWLIDRLEKFSPSELRGATVAIVGYGSIGRQVARLLQPFGATVLASKRDAMTPNDAGFSGDGLGDSEGVLVHRLYPPEAIRPMVKQADFIVICVPLTKSTKGLISASVISSFKAGAYLIDVSRGGVVDHSGLIKSLQDGKLAGAALDVFPEEPLPPDNPLWAIGNVIITPHIADNSLNYDRQACTLFSENLHRYLAGIPLFNLYNPDRGY